MASFGQKIILAVIVILAIFAFMFAVWKLQPHTTPVETKGAVPVSAPSDLKTESNAVPSGIKVEKDFVSVGDLLGAMTVVSVKPFNTGQYSSDPKMMQLGPQNIQANLKGPIEVTGAYRAVHSAIGFDGYCMSVSDAASLARLPVLPVPGGKPIPRPYFCFRNDETAKQKLGEESRTVTVTIDNYELNSYPSEVVDWADLISVIKK